MEAMRKRLSLALIAAAVIGVSAVHQVAAADAPAPGPASSDASAFLPAVALSSLCTLAMGMLF